jgi:hypothetical protein
MEKVKLKILFYSKALLAIGLTLVALGLSLTPEKANS